MDRRSLGPDTVPELGQVVRGSEFAMRYADRCGFRDAQGGIDRERYPGRSHSGESQWGRSRLFLSWTEERTRAQEARSRTRRGAGRICRIIQLVAWNRGS